MAEIKRWKTRPLEVWQKAKEFRTTRYADYAAAHKKGELASMWDDGRGGLGKVNMILGEHYGANCANMGLSMEFMEAAEAKGYARDLCAYTRLNLGSLFLDKYAFGGPYPKVDFVMREANCDTHIKWAILMGGLLNAPVFCTDYVVANEFDSEQSKQNKVDYIVGQTLDGIEWLEKTTGRKFDDEAYIENLYKETRRRKLWGQICLLNQNVPAPIDEKSLLAFYTIDDEDITRMLRDELEDRVRNQIAAVATERFRIMHVSQPLWYALKIFRYLEKYGAVSVGSRYTFMGGGSGGGIMVKEGIEIPEPTLEERGIFIKTREQAVRTYIERRRLSEDMEGGHFRFCGRLGRESQLRMARLWHCDAALIHLNRGCEGYAQGLPQVRLAFIENNIPVLTYEGNVGDPREFDEARTMARFDTFFEGRGLAKLED